VSLPAAVVTVIGYLILAGGAAFVALSAAKTLWYIAAAPIVIGCTLGAVWQVVVAYRARRN